MTIFLVYEIFDNSIWDDYNEKVIKAFKKKETAINYINKKQKENKEKYIFYYYNDIIL